MRKPTALVAVFTLTVLCAFVAGASPAAAQPSPPAPSTQPAAAAGPAVAPATTPEPLPQAASCTIEESTYASFSNIKTDKHCQKVCENYCHQNGLVFADAFWSPRVDLCDCRCCPGA